jgi:hypothetical protein
LRTRAGRIPIVTEKLGLRRIGHGQFNRDHTGALDRGQNDRADQPPRKPHFTDHVFRPKGARPRLDSKAANAGCKPTASAIRMG